VLWWRTAIVRQLESPVLHSVSESLRNRFCAAAFREDDGTHPRLCSCPLENGGQAPSLGPCRQPTVFRRMIRDAPSNAAVLLPSVFARPQRGAVILAFSEEARRNTTPACLIIIAASLECGSLKTQCRRGELFAFTQICASIMAAPQPWRF